MEFGAPVWAPWTAEEKQVLEREQQQAVEMISGLKGHTYEEKCKEIGLETLERIREDMNNEHDTNVQNCCEGGQSGQEYVV